MEEIFGQQRQDPDQRGEEVTLNNLSQIYRELGDLDAALKLAHRALEISQRQDDEVNEVVALSNISSIYYLQSKFQGAERLARQALLISQSMGNKKVEEFHILNLIVKIEVAMGVVV